MSRICVKNLPKYATADQLREFFSQKGEVTDAKLMRTIDGKSRQFAFIGYRTEQEAQQAIQYFNKSYLDTCRIICEIARKVGDPDIPRPWSRYSKEKEDKSTEENKKFSNGKSKTDKKNAKKDSENDDPKLQEFFQVMQPRSKSKLWANDLVAPSPDQNGKVNEQLTQLKKEGQEKPISSKVDVTKSDEEEDTLDDKFQEKLHDPAHNKVVTDMDYFRSRVRKDWSDSESSDDDGNGSDHEDEDVESDDDATEDSLDEQEKMDKNGHVDTEIYNTENEAPLEQSDDELPYFKNPSSSQKDASEEAFETGRLFVRNLPYAANEDELVELFSKFGNVSEVHLVVDKETKRSKGFAYVRYSLPESAVRALEELDHSIFQGRLLHVLPAKAKNSSQHQEMNAAESKPKTLKEQRLEEKKAAEAGGDTRAWNSLFMRPDTVVENVARKYGLNKSEVLNHEDDDLAVKVALGEAKIIAETKQALANSGVNVACLEEYATGKLEGMKRSNHVVLVKNLPYSATEGDLSQLFGKFGSLEKIVLPPTRTMAVVVFLEPGEARAAFRGLAYKRYKDAPLYLEWAPSDILSPKPSSHYEPKSNVIVGEKEAKEAMLELQVKGLSEDEIDPDRIESRSLFVKNLNFKTTDESLRKHINENMKDGKILSVNVKKHLKNGKNVSMGFGFVEFDSVETATNVCRDLQGTVLEGHALIFQICRAKKSEKVLNKAENDRSSTKLIVRNVAFEATEKDLRQLFSNFGQVKSLRLPMRFGKHRGFAFVEYVTKQEAQNALQALASTHLYGRHLVLERAKEGETLEELRARTAAQFANDEDELENPTRVSKKRKLTASKD